jgi:hypothetical protein
VRQRCSSAVFALLLASGEIEVERFRRFHRAAYAPLLV